MKNEIRLIKFIKIVAAIAFLVAIIITIVMAVKGTIHLIVPVAIGLLAIPSFLMMQILQNASTRIEALSILLCDKKTITEQEINNMQTNIDMHLTAKAKEEIKSTTVCMNCGATIAKDIDKCPFCDKGIKALPNSNQNTE